MNHDEYYQKKGWGTLMQWESLYRLVERSAGNQQRLQMSRNLQFRNNPLYCFTETEKCVHFINNNIKNLPRQVTKFILTCQKHVKNSHNILSTRENPRLQPYGHSCQYLSYDMQCYCSYVCLVQPKDGLLIRAHLCWLQSIQFTSGDG
jgi:hypothetical protein